MLFRNTGQLTRVRLDYEEGFGWHWTYVGAGETIDLPPEKGEGYGFERVEPEKPTPKEGRHGNKKIETKKFKEKLKEFDGIGNKTADDLVGVYKDEESLKQAIENGEQIPIRNDLEDLLKEHYK